RPRAGYLRNAGVGAGRAAVAVAVERRPGGRAARYGLGLLGWGAGERGRAIEWLRSAGLETDSGPAPEARLATERFQARDTLAAIQLAVQAVQRHGLDPAAHGLLADLTLPRRSERSSATIEALASRVLAPMDPSA